MTIHKWLRRHGIPTRAPGAHMKSADNWRSGKPLTEATRQKISRALTGHKRSPESIRQQSESIRGEKSHLFGKRTHGKGTWVVWGSGDAVFMRSRWEIHFADWLCAQGQEWIYEPETFTLANGSAYTPDFLSEDTYYEIKGWLNSDDEAKIAGFRAAYPHLALRVLRKADLEGLGLKVGDPTLVPKHLTVTGPNTKVCPNCGMTFIPERKASIFCSLSCNSGRVRKARVQWQCAVCSKAMEGPPSDLKYKQTCSVQCGRILGARKRSGARHWSQQTSS